MAQLGFNVHLGHTLKRLPRSHACLLMNKDSTLNPMQHRPTIQESHLGEGV